MIFFPGDPWTRGVAVRGKNIGERVLDIKFFPQTLTQPFFTAIMFGEESVNPDDVVE